MSKLFIKHYNLICGELDKISTVYGVGYYPWQCQSILSLWCLPRTIPFHPPHPTCTPFVIFLKKLMVKKLAKKYPTFYGTQRFFAIFRRVHHLTSSLVGWIQPTPTSVINFNIILSSSSKSPKWSCFIQVFRPRCSNFSACHVPNPSCSSVSILNVVKTTNYKAPPNFVYFPSPSSPCCRDPVQCSIRY
jgi:hypothetical protein